jgi:glutathione synthase/RimK-type ligase-like ATP-grasp enzyme
MRPIIYPYRMASESAAALNSELRDVRGKRVRPDGRYRTYRNHLIINWGAGRIPNWWVNGVTAGQCLNNPLYVEVAGNKLAALRRMEVQDVNVPEFTTDRATASGWLGNQEIVVARQLLRASSGRGIVLMHTDADMVAAPLYTKYVKKRAEYRIHIFRRQVIHQSQKRMMARERRPDGFEARIRNHDNGWVFCHEDVSPPQQVIDQSIAACDALELDFGAVDVVWNEYHQKATVLEVNTAPGLEGATLTAYVNAIRGEL